MHRTSSNSSRTWLGCYSCLVAGIALSLNCRAQADDTSDLMSFVLAKQAESRQRIETASYRLDAIYDSAHSGQSSVETTARIRRSGQRLYVEMRKVQHKNENAVESDARVVLNDTYSAFWRVGAATAYQFMQDSIKEVPKRASDRYGRFVPRDPLLYAFGTGSVELASLVAETKDVKNLWEVNQQAEKENRTFVVTQFRSPENRNPAITFHVSPSQGFFVTKVTVYAPDGSIMQENSLTPTWIEAKGLWFPTKITESVSAVGLEGKKVRVSFREINVTDLSIRD